MTTDQQNTIPPVVLGRLDDLPGYTSPLSKLLLACEQCAEGLERDARLYPDGDFPSASRFQNRAQALRRAIAEARGESR